MEADNDVDGIDPKTDFREEINKTHDSLENASLTIFKSAGDSDHSDRSEDPFGIYPIIYKESSLAPKKNPKKRCSKTKHPKISVLEMIQGELEEDMNVNLEGIVNQSENSCVEGIQRKIKRGGKMLSRSKESGIGEVILEGGIRISYDEFVACNKLILKKGAEEDGAALGRLGKALGFIESKEQERAMELFASWEIRDRQRIGVKERSEVLEKTRSINEDI